MLVKHTEDWCGTSSNLASMKDKRSEYVQESLIKF